MKRNSPPPKEREAAQKAPASRPPGLTPTAAALDARNALAELIGRQLARESGK